MKIQDLPKMDPIEFCQMMQEGSHGTTFVIGHTTLTHTKNVQKAKVAKVPGDRFSWPSSPTSYRSRLLKTYIERVQKEFSIASDLYDSGISVPKPLGVFRVDIYGLDRVLENLPAFVMEYFPGFQLSEWREHTKHYNRIAKRFQRQMEKAIDLGFTPKDCSDRNWLYDRHTNKIALIDFVEWERSK